MQCYTCGMAMSWRERVCPSCGRARSRLIYAPFCGAVGGIAGSLIGFTLANMGGAFAGGLVGILLAEVGARVLFRSRRPAG